MIIYIFFFGEECETKVWNMFCFVLWVRQCDVCGQPCSGESNSVSAIVTYFGQTDTVNASATREKESRVRTELHRRC